ncbi:MAG: GDSL family lipase [Rubrivivax sp.]|nr:MAG: GDSL family lipase [Rubrivivax sp.]
MPNMAPMPHTRFRPTSLMLAVLLAGAASSYAQMQPVALSPAGAVAAAPQPVAQAVNYGRWKSSFDAFAAADRERAPVQNGTLFVGSSTIRMWSSLQQDFRQLPVINRGFGGSTMADCNHFARDLVIRYQPSQVLVYAGDNDLAEGHTPQQVLDSFAQFVRTVRTELPHARIDYISIKPSPSRAQLLPQIREANALIGAYVQSLPNAGYIDIHTPMLAADGQPRGELFLGDRLHLNESGYRLWQSIIAARLTGVPGSPAPVTAQLATAAPATATVPQALTSTVTTRP